MRIDWCYYNSQAASYNCTVVDGQFKFVDKESPNDMQIVCIPCIGPNRYCEVLDLAPL